MDILVIFDIDSTRMTSIENKEIVLNEQAGFVSAYSTNPDMFLVHDIVCTKAVFDAVATKAGTRQAPALIASATDTKVPNRTNVYIENGSLKIAL